MALQINILITLVLASALCVCWLWHRAKNCPLTVTPALFCFAAGVAVLAIPLAWTTAPRFPAAAWRVAATVSGLFWLFSCLQLRWRRVALLTALYSLLLLVIAQCIIATQQLLLPQTAWIPLYAGRIYGSFFQPNVLASFIATGIALILTLLLPGLAIKRARYERLRRYGLLALLTLLSALLVCIQSRAGWLGGVAAAALLFCFGRVGAARMRRAGAALIGGTVLGSSWLLSGQSLLALTDHAHSNVARWSMLRDTLRMIADRPRQGWGYGGFGYDFQHFRINQMPPTPVTEIANHPHNEILLWVVEGGLVGLAGVLLMLLGAGIVIRRAVQRDRIALTSAHRLAGVPTSLAIALLPMAIHSLLEYPFYLSTLHFVVFLMLLAMADGSASGKTAPLTLPHSVGRMLSASLALFAFGVAVLAGFTFRGQQAVITVERFAMQDVAPLKALPPLSRLWLNERIIFDEQVGALMEFNRTRDDRLLEAHRLWAQAYLQRRIDSNVYASLIQVLRFQRRNEDAVRYRQQAALFFPQDARFALPGTEGK